MSKPVFFAVCAALGLVLAAPIAAAPNVRLVEEAAISVEIQPFIVVDGESGALPLKEFEVRDSKPGGVSYELHWPDPTAVSVLRVRASGTAGADGAPHALSVKSEFSVPGRPPRVTRRRVSINDGASKLIEVYREGNLRMTLALTATRRIVGFVPARPSVGQPVRLALAVESINGNRAVTLETNQLHTFIGEPVEYSFRRGAGDSLERLSVVLTPTSRVGDVLHIDAQISGQLPGAGGPLHLNRRETVIASEGATSSVLVTIGEPPVGYRFRVTPTF